MAAAPSAIPSAAAWTTRPSVVVQLTCEPEPEPDAEPERDGVDEPDAVPPDSTNSVWSPLDLRRMSEKR